MQVVFLFSKEEEIIIADDLPHNPIFLWKSPKERALASHTVMQGTRRAKRKLYFSRNKYDFEGSFKGKTPGICSPTHSLSELMNIVAPSSSSEVLSMSLPSPADRISSIHANHEFLQCEDKLNDNYEDSFDEFIVSPEVYLSK